MRKVAALDGSINSEQEKLVEATERYFAGRKRQAVGKWA
jgi:hypothetical protein